MERMFSSSNRPFCCDSASMLWFACFPFSAPPEPSLKTTRRLRALSSMQGDVPITLYLTTTTAAAENSFALWRTQLSSSSSAAAAVMTLAARKQPFNQPECVCCTSSLARPSVCLRVPIIVSLRAGCHQVAAAAVATGEKSSRREVF